MERTETHAALRLLYAVAIADGTVSAEEERALAAAAEGLGDDVDRSGVTIDIPAEAARLTSSAAKVATFEAAVALAAVDGRCTPEEHAVLERMRAALGVDLPMPVAEREQAWQQRMREARAAMRAAEIEFLHAVGKKRESGLPQDEYEALLSGLHRAQVDALRETLDPALEGRPSYAPMT